MVDTQNIPAPPSGSIVAVSGAIPPPPSGSIVALNQTSGAIPPLPSGPAAPVSAGNSILLSPSERTGTHYAAAPDQPTPETQPSIAPYDRTILDRIQNSFVNTAVGHAIEQGLPKVADALGIHPTETVYSRSEERRVGKECRSRWSPPP